MKIKNKKGMVEVFSALLKGGVIVLIIGFIFSILFPIIQEQRAEVLLNTANASGDTNASDVAVVAIDNTIEGAGDMAAKIPTMATVFVGVLLLLLVLIYVWPRIQAAVK